jgi:DNA-binding Xre family transcriptional regulator
MCFRKSFKRLTSAVAKLQQQLAQFMRKKRGDMTYQQFSRKTGLSTASLQRIEMADQNVTLETLVEITSRLKCKIGDIFE